MAFAPPAQASAFRLLASLLVCSTLLSTGCGFEGKSDFQKLQEKRQSYVDTVVEAGGTAAKENRSEHGVDLAGWFVDLTGVDITDDVMEALLGFARETAVFQLVLKDSTITDEQLAVLDEGNVLKKCFILDLRNTEITDAGLDQLANYYVIHELKVQGTNVSKAAVERLGDKQVANKRFVPKPFQTRPEADI